MLGGNLEPNSGSAVGETFKKQGQAMLDQSVIKAICSEHVSGKQRRILRWFDRSSHERELFELTVAEGLAAQYDIILTALTNHHLTSGSLDPQWRPVREAWETFMRDGDVADQMFLVLKDPEQPADDSVLSRVWQDDCASAGLPSEIADWKLICAQLCDQLRQRAVLSVPMRELLCCTNADAIRHSITNWERIPYEFFVDHDPGFRCQSCGQDLRDAHELQRRMMSWILKRQNKCNWHALYCPDLKTRTCVTNSLTEDVELVRIAAIEKLVANWPDLETRQALTQLAVMDADESVRCIAIKLVVASWPDSQSRRLLISLLEPALPAVEVLMAIRLLVEYWPDDGTRSVVLERLADEQRPEVGAELLRQLAELWPDSQTRELLTTLAAHDPRMDIRRSAFQELVATLNDDGARTLLTERLPAEQDGTLRAWIVETLVVNWPDETTKALLAERAMGDPASDVRIAAIQALAFEWRDDEIRALITPWAETCPLTDVRRQALVELARRWTDADSRDLLIRRTTDDYDADVRSFAQSQLDAWFPPPLLWEIAGRIPGDGSRKALTKFAVDADCEETRASAIKDLAYTWPEADTREFVIRRAQEDPSELVRAAAVFALCDEWRDLETREFVARMAVESGDKAVFTAAIRQLPARWTDDTSRAVVTHLATEGRDPTARTTAIWELAQWWPDKTTRNLLIRWITEDRRRDVCLGAMHALTDGWPGDSTQSLLIELATAPGHRSDPVTDRAVRAKAVWYLGSLFANQKSHEFLTELESSETDVRLETIEALAFGWPQGLGDLAGLEDGLAGAAS